MAESDCKLDLLFSFLTDPSGMTRERACVAIADLLLDSCWKETVEEYLLEWIDSQRLESFAAIGLLAMIRARISDETYELPSIKRITDVLRRPSILSWMLLREFHSKNLPLNIQNMHSGTAPNEYELDSFFKKHYMDFVSPEYYYSLEEIESTYNLPMKRQWSYEFSIVMKTLEYNPSLEPLYFRGRPDDEHFITIDFKLSEIYRSAYLRSLAWAINNNLPINEARKLALRTCPIDLGLWRLEPNKKPEYWPRIEPSGDPRQSIWDQVNEMWHSQVNSETEWVLAQADGRVFDGDNTFDLGICGFFWIRNGSNDPDLQNVIEWLSHSCAFNHEIYSLYFDGEVNMVPAEECQSSFMDWTIYPVSWLIFPKTNPEWQYWRMHRGIHFIAPFLVNIPIKFRCEKDALTIFEGAELIGKWFDWTDGISEKRTANLSLNTGNILMLKRSIIERFKKKTSSKFCWGCYIAKYHRDHSFSYYNEDRNYRIVC